jgi:hypothetical protein
MEAERELSDSPLASLYERGVNQRNCIFPFVKEDGRGILGIGLEREGVMELSQTKYEIEKGVATVTLYRPEQLNAFPHTVRKELVEIFETADQDNSVRVVVVKGAGKAFCAGADLSAGGSAFNRAVQEGREVSIREHRDGCGRGRYVGEASSMT